MSTRRRQSKSLTLLGRIALVIGASRDAGRAIGAERSEHGATVCVNGRSVGVRPTTGNLR